MLSKWKRYLQLLSSCFRVYSCCWSTKCTKYKKQFQIQPITEERFHFTMFQIQMAHVGFPIRLSNRNICMFGEKKLILARKTKLWDCCPRHIQRQTSIYKNPKTENCLRIPKKQLSSLQTKIFFLSKFFLQHAQSKLHILISLQAKMHSSVAFE